MEWPSARLDWLVTEERRTVDPQSFGTDDVFHYSIPVLDEFGDGQLEPASQIGSGKLLLRGGEVLVSKLNPRLPRIHQAEPHDVPTLASTEFIALRPGRSVDPLFLCYWLRSESIRQFLDGATMSVTRSQQRVRPEVLTKRHVSFPPRDEQRKIADFLDAETARIDALVARKRRLIDILAEREGMILAQGMQRSSAGETVPLRRLLSDPPQYGATEAGDEGECGWPRYIRITDLRENGTLRDDDIKRLHPRLARPFLLQSNDLLFARSGATSGKAFRYQASMGEAAFAGYLIRIRVDPDRVLPEFVEQWTQTVHYWRQISESTIQATIQNVNADRYLELLVPEVPLSMQTELVEALSQMRHVHGLGARRLTRQIALLQERRQALITAAVNGELDIPGVAA